MPSAPLPPAGDDQAALDELIYTLMREADLDPTDPLARAEFLETAAAMDAGGGTAVSIDGRTFTPHRTHTNGTPRTPVDADVFNENLPDPGL